MQTERKKIHTHTHTRTHAHTHTHTHTEEQAGMAQNSYTGQYKFLFSSIQQLSGQVRLHKECLLMPSIHTVTYTLIRLHYVIAALM